MKRSFSEYNTRIMINAAFATLEGEGIIVYWPETESSFIATDISNAPDATANNTVGTYDKWAVTSDILSDCQEFMDDLLNAPVWPDSESRIDIIGSNGPTGDHYGK
tara:strand:+ start:593 stop:910 length:318 start_codon:yes stop_codon:yes gene_type:complete